MFPVVGSGTTRRNLEQDMYIGGGKLFVPKGVLVWIPMHAVQNVAANWDEPHNFMPERWDMVRTTQSCAGNSSARQCAFKGFSSLWESKFESVARIMWSVCAYATNRRSALQGNGTDGQACKILLHTVWTPMACSVVNQAGVFCSC